MRGQAQIGQLTGKADARKSVEEAVVADVEAAAVGTDVAATVGTDVAMTADSSEKEAAIAAVEEVKL